MQDIVVVFLFNVKLGLDLPGQALQHAHHFFRQKPQPHLILLRKTLDFGDLLCLGKRFLYIAPGRIHFDDIGFHSVILLLVCFSCTFCSNDTVQAGQNQESPANRPSDSFLSDNFSPLVSKGRFSIFPPAHPTAGR